MANYIKVLIVEDSLLFREVLAKGLGSDLAIKVVGKASDPFEARDKILELDPDVITCDVEMPKMNGIEFIRRLMPQHPLPIIVVSSVSDAVFEAMEVGAIDFVSKPSIQSPKSYEDFILNLIRKIKEVSKAKVIANPRIDSVGALTSANGSHGIIAIGASTGGTEAIHSILKSLPPNIPGIIIVQHIPPIFSTMFAERLNHQTRFLVKEAKTGDYCAPGTVHIAPGDQHMIIKKSGPNYLLKVYPGEKVNGHCPSVDVLFESVAAECGDEALGVILTGMGHDGAKGLLRMRRKGAKTIGQDEESCVVYGMPKVAYELGAVEKQASLQQIPKLICNMLQ